MKSNAYSTDVLLQDLGILLNLVCLFCGTMIAAFSRDSVRTQNMILLAAMFLIVVLVVFRAEMAATVITAFFILIFAAYKVYSYAADGTGIELTAYLWPVLLVGARGSLQLVIQRFARSEQFNHLLNRQVEELTYVDPLTGLENVRSMYNTLPRYMEMASRNSISLGLMLIRLRYAEELRSVLTEREFNDLRQRMASITEATMRIEDRIYTVGQDGMMGIIYFSDEAGAKIIKNRLQNAFAAKDAFSGIREETIRVDVSIVYHQYENSMGRDAMKFKILTEGEFAYEV